MPPNNTYGIAACLIQALPKDTHDTVFSMCASFIICAANPFQSLIYQTTRKPAVISRPSNETFTGVIETILSLRFLLLRHQNELIQPFP